MTPTLIQQIADRHVEAWLSTPGELASSVTLRVHVANAITEAVAENDRQWQAGADTLRHERDQAQAQLAAIRAALSFNPSEDRDLETCARRHFHGHTDALALVEKLTHEAVGLTFAVVQWREKAEAARQVQKQVKAQGAVEP